jgi:hypothetical protein
MHAHLPLPISFFRSGIIFVAFPMLALDVYGNARLRIRAQRLFVSHLH